MILPLTPACPVATMQVITWTAAVVAAGAVLYPALGVARERGWCEFRRASPYEYKDQLRGGLPVFSAANTPNVSRAPSPRSGSPPREGSPEVEGPALGLPPSPEALRAGVARAGAGMRQKEVRWATSTNGSSGNDELERRSLLKSNNPVSVVDS